MKGRNSLSSTCAFPALILLAAVAVAQVPPPAPPPSPGSIVPPPAEVKPTTTKRGSITGQVLSDEGQPLVGVGVSVLRTTGASSIHRTAMTDEEGKFQINDLPLGSYHLGYQANGYVNPQRDAWKQPHRVGEFVTLTMVKGGVITGKALDSTGQPLVGANVIAQRVRNNEGRTVNDGFSRDASSDDRGVYRIYGLDAGSYVVSVNGGYGMYYNDRIKEAPTYHPSGTRDTAAEVPVQLGTVAAGIDIRHRSERGHAISGTFSGLQGSTWVSVHLRHAATGAFIEQVNNHPQTTGKNSFAFYGLADGEYELQARRQGNTRPGGDVGAESDKRKVTVKGSDVTGIELKLLAAASIAGTIVLEASEKTDCQITRRGVVDEVRVNTLREEQDTFTPGTYEMSPESNRTFSFSDLSPGLYRLTTQLPSDHWYVKALTVPPSATAPKTPAPKPSDVSKSGLSLKSGEQLTGLTLTLAEGAAGLTGHVVAAPGKSLPARVRVHLIPAETADDVLRYYEVVTRDASFAFQHLAPGKYWLHARAVPEDESDEKPAKPVAWDAVERAKLRREAEAANNTLVLTPCQRVKDHTLVFSSTVGK